MRIQLGKHAELKLCKLATSKRTRSCVGRREVYPVLAQVALALVQGRRQEAYDFYHKKPKHLVTAPRAHGDTAANRPHHHVASLETARPRGTRQSGRTIIPRTTTTFNLDRTVTTQLNFPRYAGIIAMTKLSQTWGLMIVRIFRLPRGTDSFDIEYDSPSPFVRGYRHLTAQDLDGDPVVRASELAHSPPGAIKKSHWIEGHMEPRGHQSDPGWDRASYESRFRSAQDVASVRTSMETLVSVLFKTRSNRRNQTRPLAPHGQDTIRDGRLLISRLHCI